MFFNVVSQRREPYMIVVFRDTRPWHGRGGKHNDQPKFIEKVSSRTLPVFHYNARVILTNVEKHDTGPVSHVRFHIFWNNMDSNEKKKEEAKKAQAYLRGLAAAKKLGGVFINDLMAQYPNGVPHDVYVELGLNAKRGKKDQDEDGPPQKRRRDESIETSWHCFYAMLTKR